MDLSLELKTCTKCKVPQSRDNFAAHGRAKDGLNSWCRGCFADYARTRYETDPAYRKACASRQRQRLYGVTDEQLAQMAAAQEGRCGICREETELVIDHDHDTGRVRGLLCNPCNTAIGLLREDPARLQSAIAYLVNDAPSTAN